MICGIDEAGRGPIIGNLVMAGVVLDADGEKKLQKFGVKDSKLLSKEKREVLYDVILEVCEDHCIKSINPQ